MNKLKQLLVEAQTTLDSWKIFEETEAAYCQTDSLDYDSQTFLIATSFNLFKFFTTLHMINMFLVGKFHGTPKVGYALTSLRTSGVATPSLGTPGLRDISCPQSDGDRIIEHLSSLQ